MHRTKYIKSRAAPHTRFGSKQPRLAGAAVIGRRHEAEGAVCQDAVATFEGQRVSVIALADGAGSAPLSHEGAQLVVSRLCDLVRSQFAHLLSFPATHCAEVIVRSLQSSLKARAAALEVTPQELACTLLFAATDGKRFLTGQLGDGRIAVRERMQGDLHPMFQPAKGEFYNQTCFVTNPQAWHTLPLCQGNARGISGFALMSDGAEESLFHRATGRFAPALTRMMDWTWQYSKRKAEEALTDNLRDLLRLKTLDDVSVAILRLPPRP